MTTAKTNDPFFPAWRDRAKELGKYFRATVARTDATGRYRTCGRDGSNMETWKEIRSPGEFNRAIVKHFEAEGRDGLLAPYHVHPETLLCTMSAIDVDFHGTGEDDGRNSAWAIAIYDRLREMGFTPMLTSSNGRGGYHLRIYWAKPIPWHVATAFAVMVRGLVPCEHLTEKPELYPRAGEAKGGGGGCPGGSLRLPGRHHTYSFWSEVYGNDGEWLAGNDAIDAIVTTPLNDPALIPATCWVEPAKLNPPVPKPAAFTRKGSGSSNGRTGEDVFAVYNASVSLAEVVSWHEQQGCTIVTVTPTRVDLRRPGKSEGGAGLNVEVRNGVPITYSHTPNAGLPQGRGLSPVQVRFEYAKVTYAELAKELKKELGWNTRSKAKATQEVDPFEVQPNHGAAELAARVPQSLGENNTNDCGTRAPSKPKPKSCPYGTPKTLLGVNDSAGKLAHARMACRSHNCPFCGPELREQKKEPRCVLIAAVATVSVWIGLAEEFAGVREHVRRLLKRSPRCTAVQQPDGRLFVVFYDAIDSDRLDRVPSIEGAKRLCDAIDAYVVPDRIRGRKDAKLAPFRPVRDSLGLLPKEEKGEKQWQSCGNAPPVAVFDAILVQHGVPSTIGAEVLPDAAGKAVLRVATIPPEFTAMQIEAVLADLTAWHYTARPGTKTMPHSGEVSLADFDDDWGSGKA